MECRVEIQISGLNAFAFYDECEEKTLRVLVMNNEEMMTVCSGEPIHQHYPYLTFKFHQATDDTIENLGCPKPIPDGDGELVVPVKISAARYNGRCIARDISLNLPCGSCVPDQSWCHDSSFKWVPSMKDLGGSTMSEYFYENDMIESKVVLGRLKLHGGRICSSALERSSFGNPRRMSFVRREKGGGKSVLHTQRKVAKRTLFRSRTMEGVVQISGFDDHKGCPMHIKLAPRWKGDTVSLSVTNLPHMRTGVGFHFARYFELCKNGSGYGSCIFPTDTADLATSGRIKWLVAGTGNAFCPIIQCP